MTQGIEGGASEAAERYAQAAFELARDANALDVVDRDFVTLSKALAISEDLRRTLRSPLIDAAEKSRALTAVAAKLGLSTLTANLIGVMARNRRAADLEGVGRAFRRLFALHRGATQVDIVSARPLDDAQLEKLTAALGKALGSKVDPSVTVDQSLIAGFVVRAGSRQFDASVKTKLDSLKLALKTA